MSKLPFVEPTAMKSMVATAIADGQPGMVVVCYDIEKEFVESCFGDDAGLVMTKKWHEQNSDNMIDDMTLALGNVPTLEDGSGSENAENS
ncbi:MAG: hypothetical protein RLO04_00920 [Limnobacter sp.]|uniref:hypothetical protein n=1 Tax=Limnobacter sp. TaxID=2003368 RepID=UPI0032EADA25